MSAERRVLIAEDEQAASLLMKRMVTNAGFEPVLVKDGLSAVREVESGEFHALLIDWMLPELDGIEVARAVSKRPGKRPRIILTSVIDIPSAKSYAMAAGAHDFLPKPIAAARLIEILRSPPANVEHANHDSHPIARTKAWAALPAIVTKCVGDLLGAPASTGPEMEVPAAECGAACILMDAAHGWEMTTELLASSAAAREVGTLMLGEDLDGTSEAEMLAEVLNVVVGAAKTAFFAEGFSLTLGLASRLNAEQCNRAQTDTHAGRIFPVEVGGTIIGARFMVRAAGSQLVRVEELREGNVLADDVLHPSGGMLLPSGTRLTESAAFRLAQTCRGRKVRVLTAQREAA